MELNFVVDETYLITHTLANTTPDRFSSQKFKRDIIIFQNFAWKKSRGCFKLISGKLYPEDFVGDEIILATKKLNKFLKEIKKSQQFKKILEQTKKYLNFCKKQWDKNYKKTLKIMEELTGLNFKKKFTVYITHPSLKNGCYFGNNQIAWGHHEDWPNYTTVYLLHVILHSYFSFTELNHAIITLLTDEELRVKLNGGKYPPFKGHKDLLLIINRILPFWRKYLISKPKNIVDFQKSLKNLNIRKIYT